MWRIDPEITADLRAWKDFRKSQGAKPSGPFVCVLMPASKAAHPAAEHLAHDTGRDPTKIKRCKGPGNPLSTQGSVADLRL